MEALANELFDCWLRSAAVVVVVDMMPLWEIVLAGSTMAVCSVSLMLKPSWVTEMAASGCKKS